MKYIELIARNVYFTPDAENYLNQLLTLTTKPKVISFIKGNLRNYIINDFKAPRIKRLPANPPKWMLNKDLKKDEIYLIKFTNADKKTFQTWIEYLNSVPENKDLSRIAISDLEDAVEEWEESQVTRERKIKIIHEYPDGYKWVNVYGLFSLDRESTLMQNCVRQFFPNVYKKEMAIYSLRDPNNRPHCTLAIDHHIVTEIRGKNNKCPKEKYVKYVEDFLNKKYVRYKGISHIDLMDAGLLYQDKKIYSFYDLPENFVAKPKKLFLPDTDIKLPKGFTSLGIFILPEEVTELPENFRGNVLHCSYRYSKLHIPKSAKIKVMMLDHATIKEIDWECEIETLNVSYSEIEKINPNLRITKKLIAKECHLGNLPRILPPHLGIRTNNLKLVSNHDYKVINLHNDLRIFKLPHNITVERLDLSNSEITKIPKDVKITEYLNISGANITSVPKLNLDMFKAGEALETIAKNSTFNTLDISKSKVTDISTVSFKTLIANDCKVSELPNNMTCNKIILNNTEVLDLPNSLSTNLLEIKSKNKIVIPKDAKIKTLIGNCVSKIFSSKFINLMISNRWPTTPNGIEAKSIKIKNVKKGKLDQVTADTISIKNSNLKFDDVVANTVILKNSTIISTTNLTEVDELIIDGVEYTGNKLSKYLKSLAA